MTIITRFYQNTFTTLYHCNLHGCAFVHRHTCGSRGESAVADRRYRERCPTDESMIPRWTSTRESLMHFPVTASKSRACREGHTSGPCRWLFSAARPVGDVKSLKALHRYNVVKAPALGVITVWKCRLLSSDATFWARSFSTRSVVC